MTVIPVRGLELTGNVGYVDIQYKNVQFDLNGDGSIDSIDYGLVPPRTAPWNYNIGAAYTTQLPNDMRVVGSVTYSFRSRGPEIGRASCRARVWQYVLISVGGGYLTN